VPTKKSDRDRIRRTHTLVNSGRGLCRRFKTRRAAAVLAQHEHVRSVFFVETSAGRDTEGEEKKSHFDLDFKDILQSVKEDEKKI